jgi:glycosyltransferase involved in cell wall biosynthesis
MKVLVLSNLYPPDFIGGYELGCSQVVDALRTRGHEVLVLTSVPRMPVPYVPHVRRSLQLTDIYNKYVMEHGTGVVHRLFEHEAHLVNAFNVHVLTTALEEFQPDVAYVWHLVGLGGLGLMACLQYLRVPWVWHLMDCLPRTLCTLVGRTIPALVAEFQRRIRGRYLACSRRLVAEIEACGLSLDGQVELLPNWIRGARPPARTEFFRPGVPLRIVTAGQVGRHKGMDILIEAAARLRAAGHERFSVDIYGKVTDPYFPALVHNLNLSGHVHLKGGRSQADLLELYRRDRNDVFAFPTWEREPFAFGPLEAAAEGCVPVLSRICGNAEWFVHGVHCLKAERTPEAFAGVFADILEGKIDLGTLGRRSAAVVWRDFHLDALLPRIERTLATAARQPRTGAGTAREAYHLALLAEKLTRVLVQEPFRLTGRC